MKNLESRTGLVNAMRAGLLMAVLAITTEATKNRKAGDGTFSVGEAVLITEDIKGHSDELVFAKGTVGVAYDENMLVVGKQIIGPADYTGKISVPTAGQIEEAVALLHEKRVTSLWRNIANDIHETFGLINS